MLEDELVHVLSKDSGIKLLIVVEDRNNSDFVRKLKSKNRTPITVYPDKVPILLNDSRSFNSKTCFRFLSLSPLFKKTIKKREMMKSKEITVVVNLLRLGLHSDLGQLKAKVYENISEMAAFSDNILIFMGAVEIHSDSWKQTLRILNVLFLA